MLEQPHLTPILMGRDQTTDLSHSPVENHRVMGGGEAITVAIAGTACSGSSRHAVLSQALL